ncbi:MAG: hypothetical protein WCI74_02770 [Actinomycetes bacterium]
MRTTWAIGVLVMAFAAAGNLPVVAAVGLVAPEPAAATAAAVTRRVIPRTPTVTIPVPRSWPASAARRVVIASLSPRLLSCRKTGTARAGRRLATVSIACTPRVTRAGSARVRVSLKGKGSLTRTIRWAAAPTPPAPPPPSSGASVLVPGTSCPAFPADNYWNTPVAGLPVNRSSTAWMASIGARNLHPDFGPSWGDQPVPYGIPVTIVDGVHPRVSVNFDYADESDQVGYPLAADTLIEGGPSAGGDRHTIIVDSSTCTLFETWNTWPGNPWTAGSGAVWDLRSNALRPAGWTSADAAGLPILPGLLTYDDVLSGTLRHAIRFTANNTRAQYIWPARHLASSLTSASLPPMGARFRLSAAFDISGYSPQAQVILKGMQHYGMVLADNGSSWFFQGTSDERWQDALVSELKTIPSSAFEAVDTSGMQISPDSGQAR